MRRFLVIGFIIALLIAVPIVAYFLINQQTSTQSHANPASSLLFETINNPITVGTPFKATIDVNPSSNGNSNSVSFVKLTVSYDGSKLKADNTSLVAEAAFQTILEGPTNTCTGTACTITATLSIGPNPQNAVSSQTAVATITFTPLAPTDVNAPVKLDFVAGQNQILSLATSDQQSENVFTRGIPTSITIVGSAGTSGTPGGSGSNPGGNNPGGTTPGGGSGTKGGTNQPPVCNAITVTKAATDSSNMAFTINVTGADSDGTVSKVTFNFGDGNVSDDTTGSTIGKSTINENASHTFAAAGIYTVSALLTDSGGAISTTSTCQKTVTAGAAATATPVPGTPTPTTIAANPTTIPPTGPGQTILLIGLAGLGLVVIGSVFLLGL